MNPKYKKTYRPKNPTLPTIEFPEFFDKPVHFLWVIPITAEKRRLAIDSGSEELLDFLEHAPIVRF